MVLAMDSFSARRRGLVCPTVARSVEVMTDSLSKALSGCLSERRVAPFLHLNFAASMRFLMEPLDSFGPRSAA